MSSKKNPPAALASGHTGMRLYLRSLSYFKPYVWHIILATVVMVAVGLCDAATAWLIKPAMDEIFLRKDPTLLLVIPFAFIALTVVKGGGRLWQNYLMQYCGLKVLETLRDELYRKIIMLPLKYYEGARVGVLISHITSDVGAIRASMPALVQLTRQVISLVSLLGVVFYQNAELAFYAVVVLPAAFYPFIYFGRRVRRLSRETQAQGAEVTSMLQESLNGIRVVKAFATEEKEGARFDKVNKRILRLAIKSGMARDFSSASMELIGALGIGFVLWYGGKQVIDGVSTPGTFFSFVAAMVMLYDPVKQLNSANNDIQKALAGADRVFAMLDDPEITAEDGGSAEFTPPFQQLSFENLSFSYRDGTKALDNIDFRMKAGERIALVGPSGAGKTSFVNLIPRFYDPSEGRVLLNGIPLQDYSLQSLRRGISLVSQESFLFNMSVRENIIYGNPGMTQEDAERAAKAAFAHYFIMDMPEGYDTVIGERGVKLSGGQKQRLTIARAIAKNAPLLILDEATSALDSEAERIVQMALDNLMEGRTSIVIAHRLSTILGSDRILVMQHGRIVGQGPHAELLASCPLYAKLYSMQFHDTDAL